VEVVVPLVLVAAVEDEPAAEVDAEEPDVVGKSEAEVILPPVPAVAEAPATVAFAAALM